MEEKADKRGASWMAGGGSAGRGGEPGTGQLPGESAGDGGGRGEQDGGPGRGGVLRGGDLGPRAAGSDPGGPDVAQFDAREVVLERDVVDAHGTGLGRRPRVQG